MSIVGSPDAITSESEAYETGNQCMDDLPEHACSYCGIFSPNSVVKCETCNKWFCNGKFNSSRSHIVNHLVQSRHKVVSLHEESNLEGSTLECYNCGAKNIFILGFVPAKQDSVVVILCRLPCAQQRDVNWDTSAWQSLIEDRQFLPWVAAVPTEEEQVLARPVSIQHISKLEAQWKLNRPDATMDTVEEKNREEEEELMPILLRYSDAFQYQRAFAPLVNAEAIHDKNLKESQALQHFQVDWSVGVNGRYLVMFTLSSFEQNGLKVATGDEIILRHSSLYSDPWECNGYIIKLPNKFQETFTLELLPSKNPPPTHITTGFTAEFVWKGTSYDRMQNALRDFALERQSCSAYIYHKLLGHQVEPIEFDVPIPKKLSHPKLQQLNISQENAVRDVLKRPLSLIQGPPGTGKTVTSAVIVYHLSKLIKDTNEKILVCAPSNIAVDHLVEKLDYLGLKVIRLTAKAKEDVESSVSHLALHNLVIKNADKQLMGLMKKKEADGQLPSKKAGLLKKLLHHKESSLLKKADIICCTCVGAGDKRLAKMKFRTVLIDESTQASEPESLIPLVRGAKQVVLVGDHQQLGPVILDKKAGDVGLRQSLFERLILLGHVPIRLEVQYRMHPSLSEFPSNMFYEGMLQNGVTAENRQLSKSTFPWPVKSNPMMFWCNYGREEISPSGNSYLNRVEAVNVERVISRLFKDGVKPDQIGIITPYEGQRVYILQYMSLNGSLPEYQSQYLEIEVTSVDGFQGREKDYIILSCVRANDQLGIGFLKDPRRMNVALTRAKYGMVVLGNPISLSKNSLWSHLLIHFRERGCLVEGTLENLQLSMVQLNSVKPNKVSYTSQRNPTEFDTESMISHAPDDEKQINDSLMWPSLGDTYSETNKISSNFAQSLDRNDYQVSSADIDENIANITSAFNEGLEI